VTTAATLFDLDQRDFWARAYAQNCRLAFEKRAAGFVRLPSSRHVSSLVSGSAHGG
jgi:hypothetical protein